MKDALGYGALSEFSVRALGMGRQGQSGRVPQTRGKTGTQSQDRNLKGTEVKLAGKQMILSRCKETRLEEL